MYIRKSKIRLSRLFICTHCVFVSPPAFAVITINVPKGSVKLPLFLIEVIREIYGTTTVFIPTIGLFPITSSV